MNYKKLSFSFLFFTFIYLSWLIPLTRAVWDAFDTQGFLWLNSWITRSHLAQNFWGLMNHKLTDWLYDLVMLSFVLYYIFKPNGKAKKEKTLEIFICILYCVLVIVFVNRYLVSELIHVRRLSPSLVVDGATRLSSFIDWFKIKETHHACFPGDHGTTAILFSLIIFYSCGYRVGLCALAISTLFILPRIIVGAHWITDVAIGSFSISALSLALLFYTGLFERIKNKLMQPLQPKGNYE